METQAGIRQLKNRLSEYLRMVKAGQTIAITERGQIIGYLSPAAPSLEERMQRLEAIGFLRQGKGKLQPHGPIVVNTGDKLISDLVVEDRR